VKMHVGQLIKAIKAHIAKGDHAKDRAAEDKAILLSAIANAVSRCWVRRSQQNFGTD
jgi:hypothetical protein